MKHIEVKFLFAQEATMRGEIAIIYTESKNSRADLLTQPVQRQHLETASGHLPAWLRR